jgi:uncharacterized membrane protein YbhN (UPF0104 family)
MDPQEPPAQRTWRSRLWPTTRIVLALAAIAYLVFALTWQDQLTIPAGFIHGDAVVSAAGGAFPIRSVDGPTMTVETAPGRQCVLPAAWREAPPPGVRFQPGIATTLAEADPTLLVLAMLLIILMPLVQALRWWLLLAARDFAISYARSLRLHLVGCFWNCLFPGAVGGDAVKAWLASGNGRRLGDAVISVVVDRVIGLVMLVAIGAVAAIGIDAHHRELATRIWWVLGAVGALTLLWFSARLRRGTGLSWLMAWGRRLPRLAPLIDGLAAYQDRSGTLVACAVLSLAGHLMMLGGCVLAGRALDLATPLPDLVLRLAIAFMAGSLPVSLFGIGVTEVAAVLLLGGSATPNQIIGMLVITRLGLILGALPGGWFALRGDSGGGAPTLPPSPSPTGMP